MVRRGLLINSIRMLDLEDSKNIPTIIHYTKGGEVLIGSAALSASRRRVDTFTDFKVDLGNLDPDKPSPERSIRTVAGLRRSAVGFAKDYLGLVLKHARNWLNENGIPVDKLNLLLAEPLSMQTGLVSERWLSNYRRNLTSVLRGVGFRNVDFLPEPFAVFQYYRYGVRHPLLAGSGKKQALVVDFGGGTFDVCIIETTKEGEISQGGRNSRPLAASSQPVGGFYLNRLIAQELLNRLAASNVERQRLKRAIDIYHDWRRGSNRDLATLADQYKTIVEALESLTYEVEEMKLALSNSVDNWALDVPLDGKAPIPVEEPFSGSRRTANMQFSQTDLREIFVSSMWKKHLKPTIRLTIERSREELQGAPISIVLLSGGSANLRWLEKLIQQEFSSELEDAEILWLEDYQEVVAKGLAVECVRRFFNEEGDFSGTTYNRLCLILDADGTGRHVRRFVPRTDGLPAVAELPGVLLPSASILSKFVNKPMRWRVRLDRPPRKYLEYYFLRSSVDPEDLENLQNVQETKIHTPSEAAFDAAIQCELTVREDGTANPRFIHHAGMSETDSTIAQGQAFYLDMADVRTNPGSWDVYLGLDFGTSNTSVSVVDQLAIQVYRRRAVERDWNELSDLVSSVPYPLASPLGTYLTQREPSGLVMSALEFFEGALAIAAYTAYLEHCVNLGTSTYRLFRGFTQRSVGPLWRLLQDTLGLLGTRAKIADGYHELLTPELKNPIDAFVHLLSDAKHGKAKHSEADTVRPIQILANISSRVFGTQVFGFFDLVQKQRFKEQHVGFFRHAHGNPPFVRISRYEGTKAFSDDQAYIVNPVTRTGLPLHPLILEPLPEAHWAGAKSLLPLRQIQGVRRFVHFQGHWACVLGGGFDAKRIWRVGTSTR